MMMAGGTSTIAPDAERPERCDPPPCLSGDVPWLSRWSFWPTEGEGPLEAYDNRRSA